MSVFEVILVCTFPHSDSIRSSNAGKCRPGSLQIRTLFTQCSLFPDFLLSYKFTKESNNVTRILSRRHVYEIWRSVKIKDLLFIFSKRKPSKNVFSWSENIEIFVIKFSKLWLFFAKKMKIFISIFSTLVLLFPTKFYISIFLFAVDSQRYQIY